MSAQVLRDIPFYATFFGFYEFSCRYLRATTKWNDTSVYFVSGGLAGQVNRQSDFSPLRTPPKYH